MTSYWRRLLTKGVLFRGLPSMSVAARPAHRVLGGALDYAQGDLAAVGSDAACADQQLLTIENPSRNTTSHRWPSSGRYSSWSSRSAVAATNRRETVEREVPIAIYLMLVSAGSSATGSTARPASCDPPSASRSADTKLS
jgi:hypothetical protein